MDSKKNLSRPNLRAGYSYNLSECWEFSADDDAEMKKITPTFISSETDVTSSDDDVYIPVSEMAEKLSPGTWRKDNSLYQEAE